MNVNRGKSVEPSELATLNSNARFVKMTVFFKENTIVHDFTKGVFCEEM